MISSRLAPQANSYDCDTHNAQDTARSASSEKQSAKAFPSIASPRGSSRMSPRSHAGRGYVFERSSISFPSLPGYATTGWILDALRARQARVDVRQQEHVMPSAEVSSTGGRIGRTQYTVNRGYPLRSRRHTHNQAPGARCRHDCRSRQWIGRAGTSGTSPLKSPVKSHAVRAVCEPLAKAGASRPSFTNYQTRSRMCA